MDYPFLYSFATSVLKKLDHGNPNDMKEDVEMLKGILNHLPSILETHDHYDYSPITFDIPFNPKITFDIPLQKKNIVFDIQRSVIGLHDLLNDYNEKLHPSFKSSWKDLVAPLTKFHDYKYPESSKKEENLVSSLSVTLPEIESQDAKVNNLPVHLVPCLAYCALYPKGYRVVRETLINQWMAEGFLELQTPGSSSISGDLELEDTGNCYFMELLSMGVFIKPLFDFGRKSANQQAVTVYSCAIHPEMHELACQMALKEVLVINSRVTEYLYRTRRCTMYIALRQDPQYYELIRESKNLLQTGIRTCLFFVPKIQENVLDRIISDLSELQILDLAEIQFEKLPASLSKTGKLRYLAFSRNTLLKRLDNINWSSLQTLAIDGCVELDEVNLEHTSHMRHLYYTSKEATLEVHTSTLRILQLSYCSELRSFSLSNSTNFTCLRRLRIFECPRLVSLPDSIDLLSQVQELVFHNCTRLDLNYGRSMDSLPSLQYMELIGLPKLTELPAGLQSAGALQYLMIADCKRLRSTDHALQHLVTLQRLCVYDCATFSIAPIVFQSLTALQSLDIRNCPNITIRSTSDPGKHHTPFISHIPEIILDGQQLLDPSAGFSRKDDAARGPQKPSFGAQSDSFTRRICPHFILSLETFEKIKSSQGMVDQKYKLKVPSKWKVLAQALKAIVNWKILQQQKLYCCLFPGDYEFERDTLFQLWMVRGFLPEKWEHHFNRLLDAEYIHESRTDILTGISKYTVNVGKVTALSNSFKSKDHYTLIQNDEETKVDGSTSWHHISVASKSVDRKVFQRIEGLSELRSVLFLLDYGSSLKHIPSTFFTTHQNMQALDLSGSHISELPSSVGKMTDLRFLDLSFTLIERIPESIHLLTELQTLKLRGCKHLHTLPKGMKDLVNLYHLDFDVLGQLTSMPKGLGSLTKLRTLPAFIVSKEDGCRLRELKGMNNLCGSLCISGLECSSDSYEAKMEMKTHLTRLHLKWNGSKCYGAEDKREASFALRCLRPHSSLSELLISNHPGSDFPFWIKVANNLVSITFLNCEFENLNLEFVPNLSHLNIYDLNRVTKIKVVFPKLKTLTIDGMRRLERFGIHQLREYEHLQKVSIKNCPKLTGLPFLRFLGSLKYLEISHCKSLKSLPQGKASSSLETLIIDKCPLLKTRCSKGGEDWEKIEHVKDIWIDMKHIRSSQEDKDSLSEDESAVSDDESESSGEESD